MGRKFFYIINIIFSSLIFIAAIVIECIIKHFVINSLQSANPYIGMHIQLEHQITPLIIICACMSIISLIVTICFMCSRKNK